MKKRKVFILSLILIFIIILMCFFKAKDIKQFNDILFVKLFNNGINKYSKEDEENLNNQYENDISYEFDISYENTKFKNIDLIDTVNSKTLIYEKIAPGSEGYFNIILKSNKFSEYKIKFESLNLKPQNLKFKAYSEGYLISDECDSLEQLSEKISGKILKNEKKIITIKWYWKFYNTTDSVNQDIQDTNDSKNIRQYNFNIYAIGREI